MCLILYALIVIRRRGSEHLITYAVSIYIQFIKTETDNIKCCFFDLFSLGIKDFPEISRRQPAELVFAVPGERAIKPDPPSPPIHGIHQSRPPIGRFTPGALAMIGPYLYLPVALLPAPQRFAGVLVMDRCIGG